jgi:tripartite-type tricarboxylate transporter receptor subunit TctC
MITRRRALAGGIALPSIALRSIAPGVAAGRWLTMIVGGPAGSRIDTAARDFAPMLAKHLPFIEISVRNVPGGAGLTALNALASAPATGATVGWITTPSLPARMVDRGGEHLLEQITLLGAVEREPIAFVSSSATPLDSVQDIIRRAGEDADAVPLGTPPPGSPPHLAALRLQVLTQTRLNIVTFPSATAARQAVLAGNVSAAALGLSDVIDALRGGRLAGLGIAARNRAGILPDLPVLNEAGVPLSAAIRRGLAAPAGLPAEVASRLVAALRAVSADEQFRAYADTSGLLVTWIDGPAWAAQVENERMALAELWTREPWLNANGG